MTTSTLANERGAYSSQVLVALRFFACGSFQLAVGDLFCVSKSTVCRTIHKVAAAFAQLMPRYVHFHQQRETGAKKAEFQAVANFPKVVLTAFTSRSLRPWSMNRNT